MANNRDRRVSNLEDETGGGDETRIVVNWREDDLMLDQDTGEYVPEEEWRKRHPKERLIIVGWDDDGTEQEQVPA